MDPTERKTALEKLEPFAGEWSVRTEGPADVAGRSSFEWALGGQFLVQRTTLDRPEYPDSVSVYSVEPYLQHYYDTRGVSRLYEMTLEGRDWNLHRGKADFTPLPFHQRFRASFSEDGNEIRGAWEKSDDGERWELDFVLVYTRG